MNIQEKSQELEITSAKTEYQRILVAVDYLASTPQVFEQALDLAKKYDSCLMIFHCVKGQMPGMSEVMSAASIGAYGGVYSRDMLELEEQLIQETTEELQAWLRSFVKRANEQEIIAESDYQIGEPGKRICELAQTWDADLIIIGRRGRRGLSEILLGSVSNYVIHHAPCSVLVVQN